MYLNTVRNTGIISNISELCHGLDKIPKQIKWNVDLIHIFKPINLFQVNHMYMYMYMYMHSITLTTEKKLLNKFPRSWYQNYHDGNEMKVAS